MKNNYDVYLSFACKNNEVFVVNFKGKKIYSYNQTIRKLNE